MILLFTTIIINLITVIAFYFVGKVALNFTKLNNSKGYSNYFFSLLAGFLISTTLYAIVVTGFKTTLLSIIPVIIWALYNKQTLLKNITEKDEKHSVPQLIIAATVMITIINALFFNKYIGFEYPDNSISWFHADSVFYANVAAHLNELGCENNLFHTTTCHITLYHYTELWLTAFLNRFTGGTYILTFIFQALPVIFFILWTGFIALTESLIKKKSLLFYISVSAICFVTAPLANMIVPFSKILKGDLFELTFAQYYKLAVIQLFLVAIILVRNNIYSIFCFLIFLAIYYPTTLVAIYALIFSFLAFEFIRNKYLSKQQIGAIVVAIAAIGILISFLFSFNAPSAITDNKTLFEIYIVDVFVYIKTAVNIFGSTIINITASCIPYIILLFIVKKYIHKSIFYVGAGFVALQFLGLIAWAITSGMPDSVQLWSNLYSTAMNTLMFIIIIAGLSDPRKWVKLISLVFIVANIYFHHPFITSYHEVTPGEKAIIEKVKSIKDPKFVYLKHPSEFSNIFLLNTNFAIPAVYLSYYVNSYKPVCINSDSVAQNDYWGKKYFSYSPFIEFIQNKNLPFEQLQSDYIKSNNIHFVIASEKAQTPEFLLSMTDTVIIDDLNKLRLIVLK